MIANNFEKIKNKIASATKIKNKTQKNRRQKQAALVITTKRSPTIVDEVAQIQQR